MKKRGSTMVYGLTTKVIFYLFIEFLKKIFKTLFQISNYLLIKSKKKARSMAAQLGETEKIRFIIGTQSLREENEIHLIEVSKEDVEVRCINIFNHREEIWSITACPSDPLKFFTCYTSTG